MNLVHILLVVALICFILQPSININIGQKQNVIVKPEITNQELESNE